MVDLPKMSQLSKDQRMQLLGLGAAALAGVAIRAGLHAGWRVSGHGRPPVDPLHGEESWKEAALFSLATGLAIGVARLAGRTAATAAWDRYQTSSRR